jgi:hypothetical protein
MFYIHKYIYIHYVSELDMLRISTHIGGFTLTAISHLNRIKSSQGPRMDPRMEHTYSIMMYHLGNDINEQLDLVLMILMNN